MRVPKRQPKYWRLYRSNTQTKEVTPAPNTFTRSQYNRQRICHNQRGKKTLNEFNHSFSDIGEK